MTILLTAVMRAAQVAKLRGVNWATRVHANQPDHPRIPPSFVAQSISAIANSCPSYPSFSAAAIFSRGNSPKRTAFFSLSLRAAQSAATF